MKNWNFINGWNWKRVLSKGSVIMYVFTMTFTGTHVVRAEEYTSPDIELLEFLGEGVQVENEIIDPMGYHEIEKITSNEQPQKTKPEVEHE